MSDSPKTSGWGFPLLAKKAHYFEDGFSICHRWWYMGIAIIPGDQDKCKTCTKILAKRSAKK